MLVELNIWLFYKRYYWVKNFFYLLRYSLVSIQLRAYLQFIFKLDNVTYTASVCVRYLEVKCPFLFFIITLEHNGYRVNQDIYVVIYQFWVLNSNYSRALFSMNTDMVAVCPIAKQLQIFQLRLRI